MSVLTLDQVKGHLGIDLTDTTHDTQLTDIISAAQGVVEGLVGPLSAVSYTETYNGGGYDIILRHVPVVSVESIVESWGYQQYTLTLQPVGQSVDQWGYDIENPASGRIVRRGVGGWPFPFFQGVGNIAVSYTAGRTDLPGDIELALIRQIRLLWADYQSGRAGPKPRQQNGGPLPLVDPYIADLLGQHLLQPGIA